ncbi:sulfite exporter TauE/SafE family protein [Limisphaera sp. 4302-co]|uniref:sulfite exporter TauE/SafE family protein n=1 Tax=Limisphaera sp. 4302-co TaxID=3400417 RepID=UPI003C1BA199
MDSWENHLLAGLAVLFIGLSKAGFGGGLGMLTTPLCALAFPPRDALGMLLPLLCAGDAFSLYYYWRKWEPHNLWHLLPGVVPGVILGAQWVGRFSARELNVAIGLIAVGFVLYQVGRDRILRVEGAFRPNLWIGFPFGLAAGLTSTFAHGAGPVVSMFLVPQRLPKEVYVGTTALVFTWINWIKVPFYVANGVITPHTLGQSLLYLPLVPLGVWLGVKLNRRFSETLFSRIVLATIFLTGLQLIFEFRF